MEGFILVNKPKGITSFDVIKTLRSITGIKKIGHCGTLDPNATGLLICAIGRSATRDIDLFLKKDKEYIAEIKLGKTSDTYDVEGKIENKAFLKKPTRKKINEVLKTFIGEIEQVPPIFSAKKIGGEKAYELARAGKKPILKTCNVTVHGIKTVSYRFPTLKIIVSCGSGTYIRSLAHDIGIKLDTGAILNNLTRTKIDGYKIKKSIFLKKINKNNWQKYIFQIKK